MNIRIGEVREQGEGIYVFPLFSPIYCRRILREVAKHPQDPADQPNGLNRYGARLADVGLTSLADHLLNEVVKPLAKRFFPAEKLAEQYGFIVDYEQGKQRGLVTHYDASDVTLNVCLGRKFEGGTLVFSDPTVELDHKIGQAVLHHGTRLHRAKPLESGQRSNLILWCRRKRKRLPPIWTTKG